MFNLSRITKKTNISIVDFEKNILYTITILFSVILCMSKSDSKSRSSTISVILKLIAFSMLALAGYLDLSYSDNTIFQDPFSLGALAMAIASLLMLTIHNNINYIHFAMFFFIFTKIISQITHSKHYTILGHHR
tara:strand:+ start:817 stop:1218 length:402 start_codon:yes stop_codon:yes gene_type:complete